MPNHVLSEIIFDDVRDADIEKLMAIALNRETGLIDFDVLLPVPINAWQGNCGSDHESAFRLTALDWCTANWGTKWNAYGAKSLTVSGNTVTLVFKTAWRPPYGWIVAMFNTLKINLTHAWISEGTDGATIGAFRFNPDDKMEVLQWRERPATETEYRRLHKMMWGVEKYEDE